MGSTSSRKGPWGCSSPESAPGSAQRGSLQPPLQHQTSRVLSRPQGRWLAGSLWISARAWRCGSICFKTHFLWIPWYRDPTCASWIRFWCFQNPESQTSARNVHSYLVDSLFRIMKRAVQKHFSKSSQGNYLKEAEKAGDPGQMEGWNLQFLSQWDWVEWKGAWPW